MKPRNFRYAEVSSTVEGTAANRPEGPVTIERLVSLLRHENQHLRAVADGRGRMLVDRDLQAEINRLSERMVGLQKRLGNMTAERDRLAARDTTVGSELSELRLVAAQQQANVRHRLNQLDQRLARWEQQAQAQRQSAELEAVNRSRQDEIDALRSSIAQMEERLSRSVRAESDLRGLLDRLATTPVAPLLRRRDGYRELEQRWLE